MSILQSYTKAWKLVLSKPRLWLLLYLANFLFALLALYPLNSFLTTTLGNSLNLQQSLGDFDYTLVNDVLNNYGIALSPIFSTSFVVLGMYLLFSVFLMGGILAVIKQAPEHNQLPDRSIFWLGCVRYFWRLLRLTVYFLLVYALVAFAFFTFYSWINNGLNIFEVESDAQLIRSFKMLFPILLTVGIFLFMLHDYVKIHLSYLQNRLLGKAFFQGLRFVLRYLYLSLPLYLLNLLIFALCLGGYYFFQQFLGGNSMGSILLLFVFGQLFILLRIVLKLVNLSSIEHLYRSKEL